MALGKKTGGRNIQRGQVLNPHGRPRIPEDIKKIRKMNKVELERVMNKYLHMTRDELKAQLQDSVTSAMELMIATIIHKAITGGDHHRLDFILNRLLGKVTENVNVALPVPTVIKMPSGESIVLGSKHEEEK